MNLQTYIASELEEDEKLGHTASAAAPTGDGYAGDPSAYADESGLVAGPVQFTGGDIDESVYIARPESGAALPAVLVIHENKGLVPYIENTTRRLAKQGYVAAAPDLLAGVGGTASFTPDAATEALAGISEEQIVGRLKSLLTEVAKLNYVQADRLGIVGFCYGGGIAWRMLTEDSRLAAGVPFYGPPPDEEALTRIAGRTLAIYGETDSRITSTLPGIRELMDKHGKAFEAIVYPGAGHAFHNDTRPDRYHAEAAAQAWQAALTFLGGVLKN